MIKLNIITRCTRPQFLQKVKESIFKTILFDIKWWVVFDTRVIKDIDADFLSDLQLLGGQSLFLKGEEGDMAHSLLSKVIDKIDDGFIYFLDDDNIMHENFYDVLSKSISKHWTPDSLIVVNWLAAVKNVPTPDGNEFGISFSMITI